jgi:altronate hydrolase
MTASRILRLNAKDNVAVALSDLRIGEQIDFGGRNFVLKTDVPAKHKFAMEPIAPVAR